MKRITKIFLILSLMIMVISEVFVLLDWLKDDMYTKAFVFTCELVPLAFCVIHFLYNFFNGKEIFKYTNELKMGMILFVVFGVISLYLIRKTGMYSNIVPLQLVQLCAPFAYTFFIVNMLTEKQIKLVMEIALIFVLVGYVVDVGISNFTIENLMKISFLDSYSPFENSGFAELASVLSTYFIYKRRENPAACVLSCLLVFFVFKRGLLVMMLVLLLVSIMGIENAQISDKFKALTCLFWVVVTLVFFTALNPSNRTLVYNIIGIDVDSLTMGRVYRLWYLFEHKYQSFGFGSSTVSIGGFFAGTALELDLIKIYLELGLFALIVFVLVYYSLVKKNFYCYLVVTMSFLNLLMSSSLTNYLGWTIRLLCIALITIDEPWDRLIKIRTNIPRLKIKFRI